MENTINELKTWLQVKRRGINEHGYGYGNGDGNRYGYGYGYGHEDGDGNGDGIFKINNLPIVLIDQIQTIITHIKGNIAKGFILNEDLTQTPCYVVKNEYYFAHGKTLKEAQKSLIKKHLRNLDTDTLIKEFKLKFPDVNFKYPASDFFQWHYYLTGSCETGRESFCRNHNINIEKDKFTIEEFINLTINSYESNIILQLKDTYD